MFFPRFPSLVTPGLGTVSLKSFSFPSKLGSSDPCVQGDEVQRKKVCETKDIVWQNRDVVLWAVQHSCKSTRGRCLTVFESLQETNVWILFCKFLANDK